jgi:hypothetical protein
MCEVEMKVALQHGVIGHDHRLHGVVQQMTKADSQQDAKDSFTDSARWGTRDCDNRRFAGGHDYGGSPIPIKPEGA